MLMCWKKSTIFAVGILWSVAAAAQDYPSHDIEMVVPFSAGGNSDLVARALQPELGKALGTSVVVVNKGGASGTIGAIDVAKAKPDGYKIGFLPNNPMATQPQLQNVPYDLSSFKYVCKVYEAPYVLVASPQAPFKTFEEFVEFAKAKPDNLIYASPGLGSHSHFASLTALKAIGATGIHTPFAGGGKIAPALLNGTVMATAEAPSLAISNDLKVLVTFTKERLKQLPDVPTMAEFGYEIDSLGPFGGLEVPAGTSDAVVAKLEDACSTAVASDSYQKVMDRLGANGVFLPGAEFKKELQQEWDRIGKAAEEAGIKK